ncbi:host specificity protein [Pelistega indica]|uniref:Host specificity protein n=1 Tax=Pelistega indica TaxID=1414851 RepID=V8G7R4_9BURK|nr:host specificity protein [Pelistega indica]
MMLPKAENAEEITKVAALGKPVYPIIESAKGIVNMLEIAQVSGVARLSFGALDLGVDLNMDEGTEGSAFLLNQMRAQMVVNSHVAGIEAPLDGVYPDFKNLQGLQTSMQFAKSMGFAGALCIHPSQVDVIHKVFEPSEKEITWAQGVLAKAQETGLAAFSYEGKMVDMPVLAKAKQILRHVK